MVLGCGSSHTHPVLLCSYHVLMSSAHYKSTAKWNLFVKYIEMLEYIENQILPFILLGEEGGDSPNFIRSGLKRPVGSPMLCPITTDHQRVYKY